MSRERKSDSLLPWHSEMPKLYFQNNQHTFRNRHRKRSSACLVKKSRIHCCRGCIAKCRSCNFQKSSQKPLQPMSRGKKSVSLLPWHSEMPKLYFQNNPTSTPASHRMMGHRRSQRSKSVAGFQSANYHDPYHGLLCRSGYQKLRTMQQIESDSIFRGRRRQVP